MTSRAASIVLLCAISVAACAGILGLHKTPQTHPFEHRAHVDAGVSCVKCHANVETAGEEGPLHLPSTQACVACHAKPHDERPCLDCHGNESTRFAANEARKHLRFEHKKHLPGLHEQCVPCHAAAGAPDDTPLRPTMAMCFGCHAHDQQFAMRTCDACHVDLPSEDVRPDSHIVHDGDFVREHGLRAAAARDLCATCHAERFCSDCHGVTVAALPWKLSFDKPSMDHLHAAGFFTRHPEEAAAQPGLCTTCHSESSCQACHDANKVSATAGASSPHPAGWVRAIGGDHGRAARLDPQSCASCHGGAGEMLCVGCHRVGGAGGNPHGPGFHSTLNKNKDDPCRKCHAP